MLVANHVFISILQDTAIEKPVDMMKAEEVQEDLIGNDNNKPVQHVPPATKLSKLPVPKKQSKVC